MYLTVIAWLYVVLMMSAVEAASPQGTVFGAITTFVLYGLLPLSILIYIMGTPSRRRARKAREAALEAENAPTQDAGESIEPDTGRHASASLPGEGVGQAAASPVREKS
jgi:hypothetical protein